MEKVRIGIVGLNFGRAMVKEVVSGPANPYFELAAVCDLDRQKAEAVAAETGAQAYFSLDELLAEPDIPAVGLFTGPLGRAELVRRIIRAGKDVMTTKPFELDPEAALAVLREARELGRVVHMNSPSAVPSAGLAQINTWCDSYGLGRPVGCRAGTWVSYREKADGGWYDDPALCPAAPVLRLGIYLINDLVRLLGDAEKVHVMHSRLFTGRPTADNAQLSIMFQNGALANVFASFCVADGQFYRNSLVLNYENGTVYRNAGPIASVAERAKTRMSVVAGPDMQKPKVEHADMPDNSGHYQWGVFFKAIRGEQLQDEVTPEQIAEGVRIVRAMRESQDTGQEARVH